MPKRTSATMREEADMEDARIAKAGRTESSKTPEPKTEDPKSDELKDESTSDKEDTKHIKLTEIVGDIFEAPDNAVLIHACNTAGSWGGGIALAFKKRYPKAFEKYQAHCKGSRIETGTAFLIPPCEEDGPKHYVGCLFTSALYGKRKDPPAKILRATGPAIAELLRLIQKAKGDGSEVSEVRMCKINSGLFKVPWEKSVEVVEGVEVNDEGLREIIVYSSE